MIMIVPFTMVIIVDKIFEQIFVAHKTYYILHANVETDSLVFGNILTLMLLGIQSKTYSGALNYIGVHT